MSSEDLEIFKKDISSYIWERYESGGKLSQVDMKDELEETGITIVSCYKRVMLGNSFVNKIHAIIDHSTRYPDDDP